ncbi:MAG: hypothetical protein K8U03_01610 [Planctomycetia bacterium]|nr:hypothetical protein [Planctomycetia bacterium]
MAKSSAGSSIAATAIGETADATASADVPVALRDPTIAGILAWAIPGAGHWYQGRRTKAVLFFTCILGTFFYGLWLGSGRVVYASWGPTTDEKRLPYVCQLGTGFVALPAMVQAQRYKNDAYLKSMQAKERQGERSFGEWFMAPPLLKIRLPTGREIDELDYLNYTLNRRFELGTIYTMVAGLLNVLVIFDALGGPAYGVSMARRALGRDSNDDEKETSKPAAAPSG